MNVRDCTIVDLLPFPRLSRYMAGIPISWRRFNRLIPAFTADDAAKVGIVVGTAGTPAYVHLQLEARKRYYPTSPLLIHDDCSEQRAEVAELCRRYGAEFVTTPQPFGHTHGDYSAFRNGLHWGLARKLAFIVKLSRRFLPLCDLPAEVISTARVTDYPTASGYTIHDWGFETYCVAMYLAAWLPIVRRLDDIIAVRDPALDVNGGVERTMHGFARNVNEAHRSAVNDAHIDANPPKDDRQGHWPLALTSMTDPKQRQRRLWREVDSPEDYYRLAAEWGLDYKFQDFWV